MTTQRLANAFVNASQNRLSTPPERAANGLITPFAPVAQRAEIPCACGCGACFVPKNNQHRYVSGHRYTRFIEDKKAALFDFLYTELRLHGAELCTAVAKAQEARDFYFSRWCVCMERCGYAYQTEKQLWERQAS